MTTRHEAMVELLLQLAALGLVEIIALTVIITNIVLGDFRMTGFWVFMVVLVAFSIKCVLDDLKKLKL